MMALVIQKMRKENEENETQSQEKNEFAKKSFQPKSDMFGSIYFL